MKFVDMEPKRTFWLKFVLAANIVEIIAFGFLGLIGLMAGDPLGIVLVGVVGMLIFFSMELSRFTTTGRDGCIIVYLIFGFGLTNIVSILFALQLYGLAFNEPTVTQLKEMGQFQKSVE